MSGFPDPNGNDHTSSRVLESHGGWLPPQRRRWIILGIIFCAMVLNYVDRQIVSILKPTLKSVFAMDDVGYAMLVNAFMFCYAGTYAVAGWLVDRFGAGRIMLFGIIGWSCACLGGALTKTFGQLAVMRGALGVAEPMAFPAQLRTVTFWFPSQLRATANSICAAGSTIGAIIAPPVVAWLALKYDWRAAFVVPGLLGLVVGVAWWIFYRDPPSNLSGRASEPVSTRAFKWASLWRTRSLWGILLSRFISDPVWYFCLFWLPGYLQERSGLTLAQIGMVAWIPFLAADVGGVGSSAYSDRLVRRGLDSLRARKLLLIAAAVVAPVCALTPHFPHPAATLAIFSIVGAVCLTWLFNLGVVVAEAFPARNVGSVWGIAGACGAAGAMFFNTFVGHMMASLDPERVFFALALLHPLAAVILCTMVRRETPRNVAEAEPGTPINPSVTS
jgi:MFS transporter, ACS family, hexuronate transporter